MHSTTRALSRPIARTTRHTRTRASRSDSLLHASCWGLGRRGEHEGAARLCAMPIAPLYLWATLGRPSLPASPHITPAHPLAQYNAQTICAAYVSACSSQCVAVCHTVICRVMMCTRPNNAPLAIELAIAFPEALFPPCLIASASFSSFSWLKVCVSSSTRQASRCAASEESARSCRRRCTLREAQLDSQSTWPERPPPFADLRCRRWYSTT